MPWAQWSLGVMYSEGTAVRADKVEAHKWFSLAGAHGQQRPKYLGELLAKTMTRDELTEFKKRFDQIFVFKIPSKRK